MQRNVFGVVVWCAVVGTMVGGCGKKDGNATDKGPAPAHKVVVGDDAGAPAEVLPPAPAGSVVGAKSLLQFALYARTDLSAQVVAERKRAFDYLTVISEVAPDMALPALAVTAESVADYPPPAPDLLSYVARGLSPEQAAWIAAPEAVTLVAVFTAQADVLRANKDALALVRAVAAKNDALIWDAQAGELMTAAVVGERLARWTGQRPSIWDHMSVHAVRDGQLTRIDTAGMERFGLPNLVVEEVPPAFAEEMALLVNLAAQTLFERGALARAGALTIDIYALEASDPRPADAAHDSGVTTVGLAVVEASERAGRVWKIVFPGPRGTLHERQRAALDALLGTDRNIADTENDPELLALSKAALAKLAALEPAFRKGLPEGESLYVKAPFETSAGGNEWMWVEVHGWKDGVVRGILISDPRDVPDLKAGATVEAQVDSLFDYVHRKADGSTVGDTTGALLTERAEAK